VEVLGCVSGKVGEVGMWSKKGSMRVWTGWDVFEGKFNE